MLEYSIYHKNGSGLSYRSHITDSIDDLKIKLLELIAYDQERNYPYFVDNDFWENIYTGKEPHTFYYRIEFREVSEYRIYSEKEQDSKIKNKIIYRNF